MVCNSHLAVSIMVCVLCFSNSMLLKFMSPTLSLSINKKSGILGYAIAAFFMINNMFWVKLPIYSDRIQPIWHLHFHLHVKYIVIYIVITLLPQKLTWSRGERAAAQQVSHWGWRCGTFGQYIAECPGRLQLKHSI